MTASPNRTRRASDVLLLAVAVTLLPACSDGGTAPGDPDGPTEEPQIPVAWTELPSPPGPFTVVEPLEDFPVAGADGWVFLGATGAVNVWDGSAWSAPALPEIAGAPLKVTALFARAPDDVHGFATATSGTPGVVYALRFDGAAWSTDPVGLPRQAPFPVITDIHGSADHLVAVGDPGAGHTVPIVLDLRAEGSWTVDERALELEDVGGTRGVFSPVPELAVGVGRDGLWVRDEEEGFVRIHQVAGRPARGFEDIWGPGPGTFLILGRGVQGTGGIVITEWDGRGWHDEELKDVHENVRAMDGSRSDNLWIVGKGGLILGRRERDWRQSSGPASGLDFIGVWAAPTHDRMVLVSGPVDRASARPVRVFRGVPE